MKTNTNRTELNISYIGNAEVTVLFLLQGQDSIPLDQNSRPLGQDSKLIGKDSRPLGIYSV